MAKKPEYVESKKKPDVPVCPACKRLGDHAQWCPTKNRPGPHGVKHEPID